MNHVEETNNRNPIWLLGVKGFHGRSFTSMNVVFLVFAFLFSAVK